MLAIEGLIAVISLCIACFSLGYSIGRNSKTPTEPATGSFLRMLGNKNNRPRSAN